MSGQAEKQPKNPQPKEVAKNMGNGKSLPAVPALQRKNIAQLQEGEEEETVQGKFMAPVQKKEVAASGINRFSPIQKKANNTGLPDNLKSGVENLSGYSMDDVKVHYNSDKPWGLQAHAYAQGTDIHVAPGQEKHLPHEAWHVAQQKQGRVQATTQLKGNVPVNDDAGLEQEADVMGGKAMQMKAVPGNSDALQTAPSATSGVHQRQILLGDNPTAPETRESMELAGLNQDPDITNKILALIDSPEPAPFRDWVAVISSIKKDRGAGNWSKMRGVVKGLNERTAKDLAKAGISDDMAENALKQTRVKRLVGGDQKQDMEWVFDEAGKKKMAGTGDSAHKMEEGAVPSKYEFATGEAAFKEKAQEHLAKFKGSNSFISDWAFKQITTSWKSWGSGSNFVSTLGDGDALEAKATAEDGIATLEKELGVRPGGWSDDGKVKSIYRFIVKEPHNFNLKMPVGTEGQAYQKEWVFGGKTLGGRDEAIIDAMSLGKLKQHVASGAIEVRKITFEKKGRTVSQQVTDIPI